MDSQQSKIPVGVLGATGAVGQRFVELLAEHPWFELVTVAASERSAGKRYGDVVAWNGSSSLPPHIASMEIHSCTSSFPCQLLFSALEASVAEEVEESLAKKGHIVVSNAKSHRLKAHVPLLIPEVNSDHLQLLSHQPYGEGKILTNPNCSTIGLAIALKPLLDTFGLDSVQVVTLQALSGAGLPGVPSLVILDNVIPYIEGEETKMEIEPLKILGHCEGGAIRYADFTLSAQCNRVAVTDGHLECVAVKLKQPATCEEILRAWESFSALPQSLDLPMAPKKPIHYCSEKAAPQPKRHRLVDKGMAVTIGRLRPCPVMGFKFALLSHNTLRGAAGGTLLIAELLAKQGLLSTSLLPLVFAPGRP